jgi:hypothetical protein
MLLQVLHGDTVYIDGSQLADFKQVRFPLLQEAHLAARLKFLCGST